MILLLTGIALGVLAVRSWIRQRRAAQDMVRRILPRGALVVYNPADRALSREAGGDPCVVWRVDFDKVYTPPRKLTRMELLGPYGYQEGV